MHDIDVVSETHERRPHFFDDLWCGTARAFDFGLTLPRPHFYYLPEPLLDSVAIASDWHTVGDDLWSAMLTVLDAMPPRDREELQRRLRVWAKRLAEQLAPEEQPGHPDTPQLPLEFSSDG